ncbi:MAG TPA: PD-(D/E)XK nuclease family protein [Solirubrobacteraceae bacterium]
MPGPRTLPSPAEQVGASVEPSAFLKRAEVRDVLAWLRLLIEPQDAAAVVRALGRPPVGLRQVDLARVIQVIRRRKLDLVSGLTAATESPQVPPEARERIQRFVEIHRASNAELVAGHEPAGFLARLIERLAAAPGSALLSPEEAAAQADSLERLRALAAEFTRERPQARVADLVRHLATVVPEQVGDATEQGAAGATVEDRLRAAIAALREEVLGSVTRIGGRLAELRLDTDLDISHGIVRYLELIKLSALLQRPEDQELAEALQDINGRLLAAATPLQREILATSTLDDGVLAGGELEPRLAPGAFGFREEHSLVPFLPRKGEGLALSASDIETYRGCPLRYKFARVLRIPSEQTVHQRFGIAVHQVLERFHTDGGDGGERALQDLLDTSWRRSGLGSEGYEGELLEKARVALHSYHARLETSDARPVWFERPFSFRLGPHHLRGRVDRVDRLAPVPGEGPQPERYELIDYKTSRPKSAEQLGEDIQLSLYALAASEDWGLECSQEAYYYVLDDLKVQVPREALAPDWVRDVVLEVGEGIMAQEFDPTPSRAACGICDYRIVCPAAEL